MRILFIAIASLFLTTPAAAQELSTREKVVLGGAQSALDGCKIMTKNILSFDTSIANCAGFKKSLDEKYPDDTPYNRAIKMIYLTAIDAEIARLHLLRAEPDLAGCEVVHGAIERYAGFAEFFEDTDGIAELGQSSTERLMRYVKKCPKAKIEQTFVASFGSLALELDRATTPCLQTSNTGLEGVLMCAKVMEELSAVLEAKAEPLPVDLNTYLIATLNVMDRMFLLANAEDKFVEVTCPAIDGAREIKSIFVTPIMHSVAKSAEQFETTYEGYAASCALLD